MPRSHFWEICGQGIKFPRVNSLDDVTASTKILLKLVIREDVAVNKLSINKESVNKSSS